LKVQKEILELLDLQEGLVTQVHILKTREMVQLLDQKETRAIVVPRVWWGMKGQEVTKVILVIWGHLDQMVHMVKKVQQEMSDLRVKLVYLVELDYKEPRENLV